MLNLERLRVLHAVSSTGSVSGAADTLHVTTSAVSQQVARLEREVGQTLVEPRGRGIRLTEAGSVLAEHAGRLLAEVERVEADLAGRRGTVAGRLTIAAFATAARGLAPPAMHALRTEHPDLSVRLAELEPPEAIRALRRGDVDVAIVQDWPEAPLELPETLARQPLLDDIFDAVLPADHPCAARKSVTMSELDGAEWISWAGGQICYDWLRQSLHANGMRPNIAHAVSEQSTQLALVTAGMGVAIIPRLGREPVPDTVRVIELRPTLSRQVYALWRASTGRRPAIAAVVGELRKVAKAGAPPGRRGTAA